MPLNTSLISQIKGNPVPHSSPAVAGILSPARTQLFNCQTQLNVYFVDKLLFNLHFNLKASVLLLHFVKARMVSVCSVDLVEPACSNCRKVS